MFAAASACRVRVRAREAPSRRAAAVGLVLAVVGGVVVASGLLGSDPDRTWWAYHANFVFWAGLAQGMVVFAATQKVAKGHWSGVLNRITTSPPAAAWPFPLPPLPPLPFAEAGAAFTVVSVVLFVGLFIGRDHIFTWLREPRPEIGGWLTTKWFFLRNGGVLVVLSWLSWRFVGRDLAPDVRELATAGVGGPAAPAETPKN